MKLYTKLTFVMFVLFSSLISIAFNKSHAKKSRKNLNKAHAIPILTPMTAYVTDKSSIWNAVSTVDLLIELSKVITKPEITDKINKDQFNAALASCLGNLKNLGGKWGNNMRYFWNAVVDYVKNKDDKLMVEKTFQEAFSMCASQKVSGAVLTGQMCAKIFVMDFSADKAKKVVSEFLKKFNLNPPKTPVITSFIGTHRNIAPGNFFKKMNGNRRRR